MLYVAMTRGGRNNETYLYQRLSHEADHEHAKPVAAPRFISCAAATNTRPRGLSGRFWPTTTGPARRTPRPNVPSATCFPRWSPRCFSAMNSAAACADPCAGTRQNGRRPGAVDPVHDARAVDSCRLTTESVVVPRFTEPMSDSEGISEVPYADNDAAKAAGARWDWAMRAWYAPRADVAELQWWVGRPPLPDLLPGEDRSFTPLASE
jgi:hypothetical protein